MTADDVELMADLLGDPEVMAFYAHPKDRAEALDWIGWNQRLYRERGFGLWVIEIREGGAFVGDCGITPQDVDGTIEIEVGYHVRRSLLDHHGKCRRIYGGHISEKGGPGNARPV